MTTTTQDDLKNNGFLSDFIVTTKYARHLESEGRRETWTELIERNMRMHIARYPELKDEIERNYRWVFEKKVLPSMRSLQFAGAAIDTNNARIYNCCYLPIDDLAAFSETMFLLLGGTGVGFSVRKIHVNKLPVRVTLSTDQSVTYVIPDSLEGWAQAIDVLVRTYFDYGYVVPGHSPEKRNAPVTFDYGSIRPKGTPLKTAGGRAPGPEPLRNAISNIQRMFDSIAAGSRLTPLQCHDTICNFSKHAVQAGGIRRAALISLFDSDDEEMLQCKQGNDWFGENPQRTAANNSVAFNRNFVDEATFRSIWKMVMNNKTGEPGIFFCNDDRIGTNPCCEIALEPFQFCNLCEINASNVSSQADFEERVQVAAFIGTLQASYTKFHFLRPIWKETTEREALLGIGCTGIAAGRLNGLELEKAVGVAIEENKRMAKLLGINPAARLTCVKPSGTTSLVLSEETPCSSGIHPYHDQYWLRRVQVDQAEAVHHHIKKNNPDLLEPSVYTKGNSVITFAMKAPEGAITRLSEDVISFLERIKDFHKRWIEPGHRSGVNRNNISATVSIGDDEWDKVGNWLWENRYFYNGLSFFPKSDFVYQQTPFESCTEERYMQTISTFSNVHLRDVREEFDNTDFAAQTVACGGGACDLDL